MNVRCKSITIERGLRDSSGKLEDRVVERVPIERHMVDNADGKYDYFIPLLKISIDIERISGSDQSAQLQYRLRVPKLNREKKDSFGVDLPNSSSVRARLCSGLLLGKVKPEELNNTELIVEILDDKQVMLSRTLPIASEIPRKPAF